MHGIIKIINKKNRKTMLCIFLDCVIFRRAHRLSAEYIITRSWTRSEKEREMLLDAILPRSFPEAHNSLSKIPQNITMTGVKERLPATRDESSQIKFPLQISFNGLLRSLLAVSFSLSPSFSLCHSFSGTLSLSMAWRLSIALFLDKMNEGTGI